MIQTSIILSIPTSFNWCLPAELLLFWATSLWNKVVSGALAKFATIIFWEFTMRLLYTNTFVLEEYFEIAIPMPFSRIRGVQRKSTFNEYAACSL